MGKNYEKLGDEIITRLGGEQNITKLFHCATRLRFQLADMSKAELEGIKKLPDVMGVVESVGGVQVIIGNDVASAYAAIVAKHKIENSSDGKKVEKADVAPEKNGIVSKILNVLSAILGPAIPLIMCSGLISALLIILTKCGLSTEGTTYTIISMVGNAALYFLPVLLAYTSAKKFGCDIMTSVFLGAIMISPTLIGLTEQGSFVSLFGLPVKTVNYSSTVIPIILTIWIFSYVEKLVVKIVPAAVKFVFKPLLSVIIMIPVMLCITGPIRSYCGDLLCKVLTAINNVAPWSSVLIVGCLAPLLVLTGMHLALIPLVMSMFATAGYDNMLFVAFIGMNFSQFGVALACMIKTKNKKPSYTGIFLCNYSIPGRSYRAYPLWNLCTNEETFDCYLDCMYSKRNLLCNLQRKSIQLRRSILLYNADFLKSGWNDEQLLFCNCCSSNYHCSKLCINLGVRI